ncbi:MAG: tRNA (adenosine(37)-N6)-threonylcarbamoyltransferase complex dimerization subunit type 1 TsaB [Phreatobacter sp.]|nr:tRNA (adenosine(37)-N6)-threonylcarbamoyltransferase complex dimerization subunit type 1 TsaB [Phreatobacter sp.]
MLVLALDTALGACSAAVLDTTSGRVLAALSEPMARGHAERLIPLAAETCAQAGITPGACRRFVATTGPGSFTGLRVAVAAARAMALATGGEAVGLSTLAVLAEPYLAAAEPLAVLAAIDARHGHVYAALTAADRSEILPAAYVPAAEAARRAAAMPVAIVGPGAEAIFAAWPEGASAPVILDRRAAPDIGLLARLGATVTAAAAPCRPLYLKAVDAKPQAAPPVINGPPP